MTTETKNNELRSVFTSRELEILHMDGAYCHAHKVNRASCRHSLPEAKEMWLSGWIDSQKRMKKEYQKHYYLRKKHERIMREKS